MPAIPSVVIGLGSTGSQIAIDVYQQYKAHCRRTGDNPDVVQFLLLDTADFPAGSEDLVARRDAIMIGEPGGDRLRKSMLAADPFFREWWVQTYEDIGSCYPGCSTRPLKGRLVFWAGVGRQGVEGNFHDKLKELVTKAVSSAPPDRFAKANVYLVCTLSGGTGAGIFLDVAQSIKQLTTPEMAIHGVFLLPDVVKLRADPDVHARVSANAYGGLMALNYWQTPPGARPLDFGTPFMVRSNRPYSGNEAPFDICWLIARENAAGHALAGWEEYIQLVALGLSAMTFEHQCKAVSDRVIDFTEDIDALSTLGLRHQPRAYASFSTYRLQYDAKRAGEYLAASVGSAAMDAFLARPSDIGVSVLELAERFLEVHSLREIDDDGTGSTVNDLTSVLEDPERAGKKLYSLISVLKSQLQIRDLSTALVGNLTEPSAKQGRMHKLFEDFQTKVVAGLEGQLERAKGGGVGYKDILVTNRQKLFAEITELHEKRDPSEKGQITGLHQQVEWLLSETDGHARAVAFLGRLATRLQSHRESLEQELTGDWDAGIEGQRDALERYENSLTKQLNEMESRMFSGIPVRRLQRKKKAVKNFEDQWWKPWLGLKLDIMRKEEAIGLYRALEAEITWLRYYLEDDLSKAIQDLKEDFEADAIGLYGKGSRPRRARLEEEAITSGAVLIEAMDESWDRAVAETAQSVSAAVATCFAGIARRPEEERTLQTRQDAFRGMRGAIRKAVMDDSTTRFAPELEKLSLWDAIALNSRESDPEGIEQAINARVRRAISLCSPFLNASEEFTVGHQQPVHSKVIAAYDQQTLSTFETIKGIEVNIMAAAQQAGFADADFGDQDMSAFESSPYELRLFVAHGGVPLFFLPAVNQDAADFKRMSETQLDPVIRDRRFERLEKRVGLPTWNPFIEDLPQVTHYKLLMAEHLGLFGSPLVRHLRTSGRYTLGAELRHKTKGLGTSVRTFVFDRLLRRPDFKEAAEQLAERVDLERDDYAKQDWMLEILKCLARLQYVLDHTADSRARDTLREQTAIVVRHLTFEHELTEEQVNKMIDDMGIKDEFGPDEPS